MDRKQEIKDILDNFEDYIDNDGGDLRFTGDGWECDARLLDENDLEDDEELLKAHEDGQSVYEVSDNSDSQTVIGRAAAIKWMFDSVDCALSTELNELLSEEKLIEAIKDETVYVSSHNPQASGWSVFGFGETEPTVEGSDIYAQTYSVNMRSMTVKQAHENYDVPAEELASAWNEYQEQQKIKEELNALMTAAEAAEKYGLSESAVRLACNRKQIPGRKSAGTWLVRRVDAAKRWGNRAKSVTTILLIGVFWAAVFAAIM